MKITLGILILILTGCSSSGVVPIGEGVFIISKKSVGCGFSSGEGTKIDLYKEANTFCEEKNRELITVEAIARDGVPFVRCASAELKFKCIEKPTTN